MASNNEIPVVFSTNNDYVPYCGVAIQSLKENASAKNEYHVYILHTNLSRVNIDKLQLMSERNIEVKCVDVTTWVDGIRFYMSPYMKYLTVEAYYRIFIPHIFQQYEKIVYLDCDLVLCRDVALLWESDLGGNAAGVVAGANAGLAFNSGVLIIATKEWKKRHIVEKAVEIIQSGKRLVSADNEVLQIVLAGQTTYLDKRWNFCWSSLLLDNFLLRTKMKRVVEQVRSDPWLIHYTSTIKPWNSPDKELAEYFWKYARNTVFYEEIIFRNLREKPTPDKLTVQWATDFPFHRVPTGSSIALYGAGYIGWRYYCQVKQTEHCNLALWVDSRWEELHDEDEPVVAVERLYEIDFDAVVIAVMNSHMADEIRGKLISMGIPESKIIWENQVEERE